MRNQISKQLAVESLCASINVCALLYVNLQCFFPLFSSQTQEEKANRKNTSNEINISPISLMSPFYVEFRTRRDGT